MAELRVSNKSISQLFIFFEFVERKLISKLSFKTIIKVLSKMISSSKMESM
jgi:hypothetical protein